MISINTCTLQPARQYFWCRYMILICAFNSASNMHPCSETCRSKTCDVNTCTREQYVPEKQTCMACAQHLFPEKDIAPIAGIAPTPRPPAHYPSCHLRSPCRIVHHPASPSSHPKAADQAQLEPGVRPAAPHACPWLKLMGSLQCMV